MLPVCFREVSNEKKYVRKICEFPCICRVYLKQLFDVVVNHTFIREGGLAEMFPFLRV